MADRKRKSTHTDAIIRRTLATIESSKLLLDQTYRLLQTSQRIIGANHAVNRVSQYEELPPRRH